MPETPVPAFSTICHAPAFVQRPDVRIRYCCLGAGPALVLLHGMGSSSDDWFLATPGLAHSYRLILIDLRGHGLSSLPVDGDYSIARMAEDVIAVLDEIGVEQAHMLGLSLGGCVTLQLAISYPERVRRMILTNTFARLRSSRRSTVRQRAERLRAATLDMDALAEFTAASLFADDERRALTAERMRHNDLGTIRRTMLAVARFNVLDQLQRIALPALVLIGDRDTTVPRRCADEMMARLPSARLVSVLDAGHALPFDQPERFVGEVIGFLS